MGTLRISLNDIEPQGRHLVVEDASVWTVPMEEFRIECRITTPLRAELSLLPIEGGCLVRGTLTGAVAQPCDRCAEDAHTAFVHTIETFESIPRAEGLAQDGLDDADEDEDDMSDEAGHIVIEKNVPVLDLAALCWEEFMLALPLRPLCKADCRGLCAVCGVNLNDVACSCTQDKGDSRLAALRNFKVKKPE